LGNVHQFSLMKILLAVNDSVWSDIAVDEVSQRPWPMGTQVYALSVTELPFVPTPETRSLPNSYYSRLEETRQDQSRAVINRVANLLRTKAVTALEITTGIVFGRAESVILEEAERWEADLIILGSPKYRGWKQCLLRSVPHAVASRANCSVEIVRHRQASVG
jgi:nucleotide-binding universal stress UspA family protein